MDNKQFKDNSTLGFIDKLKSSSNKLLKAEADTINSLTSDDRKFTLDHSFKNLNLFLQHAIVEILISGDSNSKPYTVISTKNRKILTSFGASKYANSTVKSNTNSIIVWDLVRKHPIRIPENWTIMNFIFIKPENTEILNKVLKDIIKQ